MDLLNFKTIYFMSLTLVLVQCQSNGGFWWLDRKLVDKAKESRENKDVKAKVINNVTEILSNRESLEKEAEFITVNDDSPDCICVPYERCRNVTQTRDGLCGNFKCCCRKKYIIPETPTRPSTATVSPTLATMSEELPTTFFHYPVKTTSPTFFEKLVSLIPSPTTFTFLSQSEPYKTKKCGIRNLNVNNRILFYDEEDEIDSVGSSMTNFGEFPWTLALYEKNQNNSFVYKCGAVLISTTIVLTAGHCVSKYFKNNPENYFVRAGEWNRNNNFENIPHQDRAVLKIIRHDQFYSGLLFNNIAILQLTHPFDLKMNVAGICLPEENINFYSSKCLVSGWGGSAKYNVEQNIQRFLNLPLVKKQSCENRLQKTSLGTRFRLHDSFVCAGGEIDRDFCKGAGGSPLVCEKHGNYYLVGLSSWGVGCGQGVPGVYVSIPYMIDWIRNTIAKLEDNDVHLFA